MKVASSFSRFGTIQLYLSPRGDLTMKRSFVILSICFLAASAGAKLNSREVPNFKVIEPTVLSRGGHPSFEGLKELKAAGFRTVISLQGGDATEEGNPIGWILPLVNPTERQSRIRSERAAAKRLGLTFDWLPMAAMVSLNDHITPNEDLYIDQALSLMTDPRYQPVFIHCSLGVDRTGLLVALFRVMNGWSPEDAHAEWVESGHHGFTGFLLREMDGYFYKKAADIKNR
jgi:protein tyrosine phosphatase (PTP) superfamily phosphohydrolase (DUF442 family)